MTWRATKTGERHPEQPWQQQPAIKQCTTPSETRHLPWESGRCAGAARSGCGSSPHLPCSCLGSSPPGVHAWWAPRRSLQPTQGLTSYCPDRGINERQLCGSKGSAPESTLPPSTSPLYRLGSVDPSTFMSWKTSAAAQPRTRHALKLHACMLDQICGLCIYRGPPQRASKLSSHMHAHAQAEASA
jgi:hypothetical protein